MAYNYHSQYRPVSTSETSTYDAVSVRVLRDMADSVNNTKAYVKRGKLLSYMFVPGAYTVGDATERLLLPPLAPRFLQDGFSYMHIGLHAERTSGSGVTTLKVMLCTSLYRGPEAIVAYPEHYVSWTKQVSTSGNYVANYSGVKNFVRDANQRVWPLVTCTSESGTVHKIRTLDVWVSMEQTT